MTFSCRSCLWSEWSPLRQVLWCRKFWKPATAKCAALVYEPGADEAEHDDGAAKP